MRPRFRRQGRLIFFGLLAGVAIVAAGTAVAKPAHAAPSGCADVAATALPDFFNEAIPRLLEQDRIPGAVVSVVSGGTTAFAKGYGMADIERGIPFSEASSLVRIASITKLFTWTAVMQQAEAGRLDLNVDVNQYLTEFQIPSTYPEPITLQNLMDHTSGFEDYSIATAARNGNDMPQLGEYLASHMPARIRPPGEISAYSNYGAALAGYIVAEVSGEPYDVYVQRHLLDPLAMTHSTASQPVPATLADDLARSYNSGTQPIPYTFDAMPPDGSITATATDMANFMNAHLHQGRFGGGKILAPETTALMHKQSFAADPRLDGYAHGFKERTINGHRVLMHDGGWEGFRSVLVLVPGCDLGLFLSLNGTAVAGGTSAFMEAFYDRFMPAPSAQEGPITPAQASPKSMATAQAGFYLPTRHNESSVEKVTSLLGPSRLTVSAEGIVRFKGKEWAPQGDGLYRAADGSDRLVFLTGSGGRLYVATDGVAYELMTQDETLPFNLLILLAFALPALGVITLPIVWIARRIRHRPTTATATWRSARLVAAGSAVLGFVFLLLMMATLVGNTEEFLYHVPLSFRLLLSLPIIVLGGAAVATALTIKGWRHSGAGVIARAHQVTLIAGIGALAWFLWQWNLIGWQFA